MQWVQRWVELLGRIVLPAILWTRGNIRAINNRILCPICSRNSSAVLESPGGPCCWSRPRKKFIFFFSLLFLSPFFFFLQSQGTLRLRRLLPAADFVRGISFCPCFSVSRNRARGLPVGGGCGGRGGGIGNMRTWWGVVVGEEKKEKERKMSSHKRDLG